MITVSELKKNYKDFTLDISMEIPEGRITGLIGRNGAGKSTTIKAILGLVSPDGGSVKVFGKEAKEVTPDDRRRMGVALSDSGFSGYLTVDDAAAIMDKLYPSFDKKAFLSTCRAQGLSGKKPIRQFSTGMKAKLRVLSALSHDADLLIMDEPTAGLDVEARQEILDILRDYIAQNEERSILITSHIATDLEGLCDDVYLIDQGRIILHQDTDVILSDYAVLKVSDEDYKKLDETYILKAKKEMFGYVCLTDQKQFYLDNYPGIVIEKCGIDDLILMLAKGEK